MDKVKSLAVNRLLPGLKLRYRKYLELYQEQRYQRYVS
jgi:hypothetical protein